jgi:hypothetical protein
MPDPANHNQLELLTSAQATAIDAALNGRNLRVCELVKIDWPSPDGAKAYAWRNWLSDSVYSTPLTDWLDGAPLVPGFVATDEHKAEVFHNIPRTAAIGDDVIQMRFSNYGQVFEELCYKWRGGVRVEVFYFFPEIADDNLSTDYTVISWFLGHLRKADRANADFVDVTVAAGFRSPRLLVPNRVNGSNCQWYFNGEHNPVIPDNPCDYDFHVSGSRGTGLFTSCNKTKADCLERMGDLESYGGDDVIAESSLIGRGDDKTISRTVGNESRLSEPIRVIYGERHAKNLQLARYAKEYHPDEDHQDLGTIRTVFKVSEGPIEEISNVKVMDRDLPRSGGLGLETRLGTQRQSPTTFQDDMLNLNRTAHFRGDINPVDPTGVLAPDIVGECQVKGRSTVRVYAADGSYTTGTAMNNNRADCMVELLTNEWFGHRMDVERIELGDIVHLRAKNSPFDADVQPRPVQQLIEDICLAGVGGDSPGWFRPFVYNGKFRFLAIEDIDTTESDVPDIIDDFGATRNVLFDRSRNVTRMEVSYRDDDEIPNSYLLTIEDKDHGNIERPLTFNADLEQYKEGLRFGDSSKRRDPRPAAAFGLTQEAYARNLGEYLVKLGPFCTGGLENNCGVTIAICAVSSLGLNMHENKVLFFPTASNPKLVPYKDSDGDPYEAFIVIGMVRTPRLELLVTLQAWKFDTLCLNPGGNQNGYVVWPADDPDTADSSYGTGTMIYSVTADRQCVSVTWPSTIDPDDVETDLWRHTISSMPSVGYSYFIGHPAPELGFRVWYNGQLWVYRLSGIDNYPAATVQAGDQLSVEFSRNGGSPDMERVYKLNGVTLYTDTGAGVNNATNEINGLAATTGDFIGPVYWEVTYAGCDSDYAVQGVTQSGGSSTQGDPGTEEPFDVLAWQVFNRPEENLEVEVFS